MNLQNHVYYKILSRYLINKTRNKIEIFEIIKKIKYN